MNVEQLIKMLESFDSQTKVTGVFNCRKETPQRQLEEEHFSEPHRLVGLRVNKEEVSLVFRK